MGLHPLSTAACAAHMHTNCLAAATTLHHGVLYVYSLPLQLKAGHTIFVRYASRCYFSDLATEAIKVEDLNYVSHMPSTCGTCRRLAGSDLRVSHRCICYARCVCGKMCVCVCHASVRVCARARART